jgi:hypothetical protein
MWKVIRGCLPIKEITEPNYRKDPELAAEEFNINYYRNINVVVVTVALYRNTQHRSNGYFIGGNR